MTPAEAKRAAILVEAFHDYFHLSRDADRTEVNPLYGDRRAITVVSADVCEAGSGPHVAVELDLETGRLLLPLLRDLITTELKKLGVEP